MSDATIHFACDNCGKRYRAPAERAGRRFLCTSCSHAVVVPTESTRADPLSELVPVHCRVCDTRMHVPPRLVGRKVKCPDCHATTEVKAPRPQPTPKPKPKPAAVPAAGRDASGDARAGGSGDDSYEVYEGEEQPWGVDLAKWGGKHVSFPCRVCQTHLQAPLEAVGKPIACPDCEAMTIAPAPKRAKAKPTLPAVTYGVEAAAENTAVVSKLFDETSARAPAGFRELAEAKARAARGRPTPPRGVMLTHPWRMWSDSAMLLALVGLSLTLAALAAVLVVILDGLMATGMGAVIAMLFFPIPVALTAVWSAAGAVVLTELVASSAEGSDRVTDWPSPDFSTLLGPLFYWLIAVPMAAAPGHLVVLGVLTLAPVESWPASMSALASIGRAGWLTLGSAAGVWLALPWVLLSQFEASSPFALFSRRLLRAGMRTPLTLAAYYTHALLVWAVVAGLAIACRGIDEWLPIVLAAPAVFAAMHTARVMGLLAWVIADADPGEPDDDDDDE